MEGNNMCEMTICERYGHTWICDGRVELYHGNRCVGIIYRRLNRKTHKTIYEVQSVTYGNQELHSKKDLVDFCKYVKNTRFIFELKIGDTISFTENVGKYMYMTVVDISADSVLCHRPYYNSTNKGNGTMFYIERVEFIISDTRPVYIFT